MQRLPNFQRFFRHYTLATAILLFLPPFGFILPLLLLFVPPMGLFLVLTPTLSYYHTRKKPADAPAERWQKLALVLNGPILLFILYIDIRTLLSGSFMPKISM